MLWPKKNSYKEFDNEKIFLRLENSPLPLPPSTITFLMIRPLLRVETGDVTKCRLFSQAGLCLTGKYLPTRIFMAVLVSILIFVDRRSCTNLTNLQFWPLRPLTQTFLGLRHAFLLLEREAGKNAL